MDTDTVIRKSWDLLAKIDDPEMPVSIVDLGIVVGVGLDGTTVRVRVTPTYTGCPALGMIEDSIRQRIREIEGVEHVDVEHVFDPPWTPARISPQGRERLRAHGVSSADPQPVGINITSSSRERPLCPYCESTQTRLESLFGPTRCRAIHYCEHCHHTFEHIKAI